MNEKMNEKMNLIGSYPSLVMHLINRYQRTPAAFIKLFIIHCSFDKKRVLFFAHYLVRDVLIIQAT